jgi:hypothetical protein
MAAEAEWLAVGLVLGLIIGIPLGWVIAQTFTRPAQAAQAAPASVVFDRDSEGRITGIHYVPGGVRPGSA